VSFHPQGGAFRGAGLESSAVSCSQGWLFWALTDSFRQVAAARRSRGEQSAGLHQGRRKMASATESGLSQDGFGSRSGSSSAVLGTREGIPAGCEGD
jgi:hypothetical protein